MMNSEQSLDRPLLSESFDEFAARGGENKRADQGSKAQGFGIETSDVVVGVTVPGVDGETQERDLASVKSKQEIKEILNRQKQSSGRNECDVSLGAKVNIVGEDHEEVLAAAYSASYSFQHFLKQFHSSAGWAAKDKEEADRELHKAFHENVTRTLSGPGLLERRESLALLGDFSSADALLEDGVDGYVAAVQKLLRTDFDDSVTITFQDLCYTSRTPKIHSVDGYSTVASQLFKLVFGCCMFSGRALRNTLKGVPPVEYDETPILSNLSGIIKPGRLTLVLGPPGCGKTSFLRAISGKTMGNNDPGTVTDGILKYNERQVGMLRNLAAWVSYVGQSDEHQSLLTVRETFEFAFKCRKEPFFKDKATLDMIRMHSGEAAVNRVKALKDVEVDVALALLGLTSCADTIIGNENLKGVSGGERRRVTLGEMLVTGSQILCCDEISTGLDSAATFDITAYLRSAAHALQKSIIVALLQPPPEVIDLFDDIILMAEGRIIYHGPRDQIQGYFESMGFMLPEGKDLGDFLVELPTRNGIDMQMNQEARNKLDIPAPPETPEEFADRWTSSRMFKMEMEEVNANQCIMRPKMFDYDDMPERSFLLGLWHTVVWSMTLRLRDRIQIVARIVANIIVGLFFGTLFYKLTIDDWWLKAMLFAMALIFLISTAFPVVQIISQQRPIFYKQVEAKFYSPFQFTLSQWIVSMPFVCFDVACFGCALYWMCGLAPHAYNFVIFLAVCISFGIGMNTVMTMFPFITRDEDTGIVTAALFLIMSVVASGALSTESMIPIAFRWMMWVNPFAWSYRALAINEYHTKEYDMFPCRFEMIDIPLILPTNCNKYFLQVREVRSDDRYIPAAVAVNFLFICLFIGIMTYALGNIRFEKEKMGAIPEPEGDDVPQKTSTPRQRNAAKRDYEHNMYLNAVSPRTINHLSASSTLPIVSPLMQSSLGRASRTAVEPTTPLWDDDRISVATPGFQMVQTPPKTLAVKDLWYTIPIQGEPVDFLKGISFYASPGRMTALMGSSGAGKTTLMDVISGRKTVGYARGDILVNGEPKVQHEFVKYTGYVEQFGVHASCATIKESLEFSANLRLAEGTSKQKIEDYVQSVLQLLELHDIQDALCGTLSMEQNKRVTLGVELVANPSIIFCDEPTSGLDARAAAIVMRVLLKVARSGRTVVCTIHQPSTAIFNFFDDLLLLKRGGECVYFGELGPNSKYLVDYLEAVPGTKPCPKGYNPATWMLETIGAGTGADTGAARSQTDYANVYSHSSLRQENEERLEHLLNPNVTERVRGASFAVPSSGIVSPSISPFYHANADPTNYSNVDSKASKGIYVRSQWAQTKALLWRNLQTYWRSPEFSLNRLLVVMLFTGIFACFFFMSELNNVSDIQGRIVNIFFFSSLTCIYNLYTLVPFALSRRALYYRERAANMYSVLAFNLGEFFVELPWICVQVATTVPLIYFLTNLNQETWFPFVYFVVCIFLILCLMTSMGLFAASLFPDALAAQLASVGALITLMVFCGIMVPKQDLPKPYIPMYYASFFKYSSEGLMTTQFHDLPDIICLPDGKPMHFTDKMSHMAEEFLHKYLPNITNPICTKTGEYDMLHPIKSLKGLSGFQMKAETFVLDKFAKDYDYENRWLDLEVLLVWIVVLRLLTFITMYFVNHQ
eukprot:CAMPEP_0203759468 /NCGR_PEP_ID=MMETSP0098-20131031/12510_1 /ASSEMBLY_ACC=CAM_ASM_000208 /TAXON_ID=96639 /ORGANISM=" , Strain NY0313808BC1" /LENGTH=1654 /DNA_ID=CAMNT_0050652455 /DNA_START=147 /DNA_END=5108 /DNA_ORIENTATION=+